MNNRSGEIGTDSPGWDPKQISSWWTLMRTSTSLYTDSTTLTPPSLPPPRAAQHHTSQITTSFRAQSTTPARRPPLATTAAPRPDPTRTTSAKHLNRPLRQIRAQTPSRLSSVVCRQSTSPSKPKCKASV